MGKNLGNISHIDLAIATGISRKGCDFRFAAVGAGAVYIIVAGGRETSVEYVAAGGAGGGDDAVFGAGGRCIYHSAVFMGDSGNDFLCGQNLATGTAVLAFRQTGGSAGGRYGRINDFAVFDGGEGDMFDVTANTAGVVFETLLLTGRLFDPDTLLELMSGGGNHRLVTEGTTGGTGISHYTVLGTG